MRDGLLPRRTGPVDRVSLSRRSAPSFLGLSRGICLECPPSAGGYLESAVPATAQRFEGGVTVDGNGTRLHPRRRQGLPNPA